MPIDDDNNLIAQHPQSVGTTSAMDDLTPPQYGDHQFDRLYSDIDPTGYMTPAGGPSGFNTPFTARSRSVSSENLASLDTVTEGGLAANILQTRLNNLDVAGANRGGLNGIHDGSHRLAVGDTGDGSDISSANMSRRVSSAGVDTNDQSEAYGHDDLNTSTDISRRASDEDNNAPNVVLPQHIEYSVDLAKVPSYSTALQSQTRRPVNDGLPTYQSATQSSLPTPATLHPSGHPSVHRTMENHRDLLRRCS